MINVAVLGHGTIGSGVVEVLQTNACLLYTSILSKFQHAWH